MPHVKNYKLAKTKKKHNKRAKTTLQLKLFYCNILCRKGMEKVTKKKLLTLVMCMCKKKFPCKWENVCLCVFDCTCL